MSEIDRAACTLNMFFKEQRLKGFCNPVTVTLQALLDADVATSEERRILGHALWEISAAKILENSLGPVALVDRLQAKTLLSQKYIGKRLAERGYTVQRVRYDGRQYNLWVSPGCRYPKVELDKLLREEKRHVPVSGPQQQ